MIDIKLKQILYSILMNSVKKTEKGFIEFNQMLRCGVLGAVGGDLQQFDIHLNRGISQQSEELSFGFDLLRHQI